MNKILKLTIVLFLVCAVVAGVLGGVNELTKDTIAEQQRLKTERAYAEVLKSSGYETVDFDKNANPTVDSVSVCTGGEGHIVMTTFSGAQGSITMVVGVDKELKCSGISIIKHSETSGLGANAASSSEVGVRFRDQFLGQDGSIAMKKAGGSIDALAGATVTSSSITNAVSVSIEAVSLLCQGGNQT